MTEKQPYGEQFFNKLRSNLQGLETKLDTKEGHLIETEKNTQLFAHALHQTFKDVSDIAGMLAMTASCKYNLIS